MCQDMFLVLIVIRRCINGLLGEHLASGALEQEGVPAFLIVFKQKNQVSNPHSFQAHPKHKLKLADLWFPLISISPHIATTFQAHPKAYNMC